MNVPLIKTMPKECPWCHETPEVVKNPLWNGYRGYHGKYEYYISCENEDCKIQPNSKPYNDIYDMTEEDCIDHAIEDWNSR